MVHLIFYKTCATKVFLVKLRCFYRVYIPKIWVFSYPLLSLKIRSSTRPTVGARMLPPKLYLVVFYQVSLVNRTRITCSDFRKPLEVLLWSACCTISHVHTPWGNCNKCSSMIVFVKDSVLYTRMAPLCPSADFPHVGTQRTLMDWCLPRIL